MKQSKNHKIWMTIIKVMITIGALYWLSTKFPFLEFKVALLKSNPFYLILAMVCYIVSQLIASSRLNTFFSVIGLKLTERYNFKLYQLGLLYNFFLPGGIGGDGYKVYFLKKNHAIRGRKVLGAVFFDRLSGLWALSLIICTLVIFMPRLAIPNYITISVAILGSFSYFYFLNLLFKNFAKNLWISHSKALLVQTFQTLAVICILYALGFNGKFSPYLLVFLISSIVAIVPSLAGGFGIRELVVMFGAEYIQIDETLAVSVSLIFYIISLLVASSGLYYIFRPQKLGARQLPTIEEVEEEINK